MITIVLRKADAMRIEWLAIATDRRVSGVKRKALALEDIYPEALAKRATLASISASGAAREIGR